MRLGWVDLHSARTAATILAAEEQPVTCHLQGEQPRATCAVLEEWTLSARAKI